MYDRQAKEIQIVDLPPGEAPEAIRHAWVGLILPLRPGTNGPMESVGYGVVSGPRSLFARIWRLLTGQYKRGVKYLVDVDTALDILERGSPDAALWWRENAPHLLGAGRTFGFAAEVCKEID